MSKIIKKKNVAKKPKVLANKDLARQIKKFDTDLYAAVSEWISRGKRISVDLGDFYVKNRYRTTYGNPFIALILQKKLKIVPQYYDNSYSKEVEYDQTLACTIAEAYGIPPAVVRGYNYGLVSPNSLAREYIVKYSGGSSALLKCKVTKIVKGKCEEGKNFDLFYQNAKKGQELRAVISHILYQDY